MRRFLAWIVMFIGENVVLFLLNLALVLVRLVLNEIHRLSPILYWAAIIVGGMTILGILFGVAFYGALIAVKLSQLVWKSKKGTRYVVFGVLCIASYALTIILSLTHVMPNVDIVSQVLFLLASCLFLFAGKTVSEEEGAPPTKREILQAKIDKLDAAEAKKQSQQ